IYPEGLTTGYYGPLTTKAVKAFQEKHGIARAGDPGYGEVGPATRAKLNELAGATAPNVSSDASAVPTQDFLSDAAKQGAIMAIQAKLQALQQQLTELLAKQAAGN
ncbi:peptidoglycan-binding protein, partial [Candidatus Woesearchaeota archaeon]|nr:peptidoglycan-binding protein [Candidatus Woesearchaeota archaeon]